MGISNCLCGRVDDAFVGLVRDHPGDVGGVRFGPLERDVGRVDHARHGESKDFAADIMNILFAGLQRGNVKRFARAAGRDVEQFGIRAVGAELGGQKESFAPRASTTAAPAPSPNSIAVARSS